MSFLDHHSSFQVIGINIFNQRVNIRSEAVAALVSLGYDGVSAGRAVAAVEDCDRVEDMITGALRENARKNKR